nr:histidine kinase [Paenibacillus shirakamiensis]
MILVVPSLIIGIWEFVRHQFLMPYLSMGTGNLITPILLFLISVTLLYQLFVQLEVIQEELQREKSHKAELEAREQMARELHDGIAQSLFLLSVKIDKAERLQQSGQAVTWGELRKTVHEVNRYVRQSISNLKYPARSDHAAPATCTMKQRVEQLAEEAQVQADIIWNLVDDQFTPKEQIELLACIREALVNTRKHANASLTRIEGHSKGRQWTVRVIDNGKSHDILKSFNPEKYGIQIMRERTEEMGWVLEVGRQDGLTLVQIENREER